MSCAVTCHDVTPHDTAWCDVIREDVKCRYPMWCYLTYDTFLFRWVFFKPFCQVIHGLKRYFIASCLNKSVQITLRVAMFRNCVFHPFSVCLVMFHFNYRSDCCFHDHHRHSFLSFRLKQSSQFLLFCLKPSFVLFRGDSSLSLRYTLFVCHGCCFIPSQNGTFCTTFFTLASKMTTQSLVVKKKYLCLYLWGWFWNGSKVGRVQFSGRCCKLTIFDTDLGFEFATRALTPLNSKKTGTIPANWIFKPTWRLTCRSIYSSHQSPTQ